MEGTTRSHSRRRRRIAHVLAVACTALRFTSDATAADRSWTNPAGGTFAHATNWSGLAVPGVGDNAFFNLANTYTVTFGVATANNSAHVNQTAGAVTFGQSPFASYNIGGNLTVSGATTSQTWLGVGAEVFGDVTVSNGARVTLTMPPSSGGGSSVGRLRIGTIGNGTLAVDDGHVLNVTGGLASVIGSGGNAGTLICNSAATFASAVILADSPSAGSAGHVRVFDGTFVAPTLSMATGGVAGQVATMVFDAPTGTSRGDFNTVTIGAASGSAGTMTVGANGTVTIGNVTVNGTGRIDVGATGALEVGDSVLVQGGGDIDVLGTLDFIGNGSVTVTGAGSSLRAPRLALFGSVGTFSNNASGTFSTGIAIDGNGSPTGISITGAADVSAGTLDITGVTSTPAGLTLSGAGSTLRLTAAAAGTIGTAGSLTVSSGGAMTVAAGSLTVLNGGTMTVGATGTLALAGGQARNASRFTLEPTGTITFGPGGRLVSLPGGTTAINRSLDVVAGGTVQATGAGAVLAPLAATTLSLGSTTGSAGTLSLDNGGAFAGNVTVFVNNGGRVDINGGSFSNAGTTSFTGTGTLVMSSGTFNVDGTAPRASFTGSLNLAGSGNPHVRVANGGSLNFGGAIRLGGGGTLAATADVRGVNGATRSRLITGSAGMFVGDTGQGTLLVADGAIVSSLGDVRIGGGAGGAGRVLVGGAQGGFDALLTSDGQIDVGGAPGSSPGTLTVSTGGAVSTLDLMPVGPNGTVVLAGGLVQANQFELDGVVTGTGTIDAPFAASATSTITAGGPLTMGRAGTDFSTAGTLNVGAHAVQLHDVNGADLGATTSLAGGTLTSLSGVRIDAGDSISGFGVIVGPVTGTNYPAGVVPSGVVTLPSPFVLPAQHVNVITAGELNLPAQTTLGGGTLTVLSGARLQSGESINGVGTFAADVFAENASTIAPGAGSMTIGRLDSFTGFASDGRINVGSTSTLALHARGFAQLGALTTLNGGTLTAPNGVVLGPGRAVDGRGVVNARVAQSSGSTINATGTLALGAGASPAGFSSDGDLNVNRFHVTLHDSNQAVLGSLTNLGDATGAGTLAAPNGVLLANGKNLVGYGTVHNRFVNRGFVHGTGPLPAQGVTFTGLVSGDGSFAGNVTFSGGMSPGNSPASVAAHNITFAPANDLIIELGGLVPGTQHDRIEASGVAALGGEVSVQLINGFVSLPGQTFEVLTFASRTDDFAAVVNDTPFAGLSFQRVFALASMTLRASATGGDANLDGRVNLQDFNILASNFGATGATWLLADFTGDGRVNLQDFNVLAGNFGFGASSATPGPADWAALATAVPEPGAALVMLCVPLVVLPLRRRP